MKILKSITLLALVSHLCGCVAAALNTSTLAVKAIPRAELKVAAEAGDAESQYKLGNSYCCMGPGFDTQTATIWYCKAARQGNAEAMFELGRIYLGEVSRTPAPGQKVMRKFVAKESASHAHMWLSLAVAANHEDARAKLARLEEHIGEPDLLQGRAFLTDWQHVACEYEEVFARD